MHLKYLCVYLSTGKGEFTGESDIGEQHRADALVGAAGLGLDGIACRRNRVAVEGLDHRQVVDLVANGEDLGILPPHQLEGMINGLFLADLFRRDVDGAAVRVSVHNVAELGVDLVACGESILGIREAEGKLVDGLRQMADFALLDVDNREVPLLRLADDPGAF